MALDRGGSQSHHHERATRHAPDRCPIGSQSVSLFPCCQNFFHAIALRYDAYQIRLLTLHNLIRQLQTDYNNTWWDPNELINFDDEQDNQPWHKDGILYLEELAWLYNEAGLCAFAQGDTHDAYSHFWSAQRINSVTDEASISYGYLSTEINCALNEIDRGFLNYARQRLHALKARCEGEDFKDLLVTVIGYLGFVYFIGGKRIEAEKYLTQAIAMDGCENDKIDASSVIEQDAINQTWRPGRYTRRASIFLRYRANLYLVKGDSREAERDYDNSLALALTGNHPELAHNTYLAQTRVARLRSGQTTSWEVFDKAEAFANQVGLIKLLIDVNLQRGEAAIHEGNAELAGSYACKALGMSNANGLALRRVNALVVLAGSLLDLQRARSGKEILKIAEKQARLEGYEYMLEQINALETATQELRRPDILML